MERETTPSQSEWLIMEVFWANDTPTMTAKEVIKKMQGRSDMSSRMVRVLLNRLWQKGVLIYTLDEHGRKKNSEFGFRGLTGKVFLILRSRRKIKERKAALAAFCSCNPLSENSIFSLYVIFCSQTQDLPHRNFWNPGDPAQSAALHRNGRIEVNLSVDLISQSASLDITILYFFGLSGIIFCQFPPMLHQSYRHRLFSDFLFPWRVRHIMRLWLLFRNIQFLGFLGF